MENDILECFNIIKSNSIILENEKEIKIKIKNSLFNNKPLKIKFGVDATFSKLHFGHLVILEKIKKLQEIGSHIIFLIGDFTSKIGDPTMKNKTRPILSDFQIIENYNKYSEQIFKIIDYKKTTIKLNSEWLQNLKFSYLIDLFSLCSVSKLISRKDFDNRLKNNIHLGVHELIYPIIQSYDSIVLEPDIEIGGNDQIFNFLLARELMKSKNLIPQCVLTMPILSGINNKTNDVKNNSCKKMSKSLNNCIYLDDESYIKFFKIMSITDNLMLEYFLLLLNFDKAEAIEMIKKDPLEAKLFLASKIVAKIDGIINSNSSKEKFINLNFSKRNDLILENLEKKIIFIEKENINILNLLSIIEFSNNSKSKNKELIKRGAIKIQEKKILDNNYLLSIGEYLIKIGKNRFFLKIEKKK